MSAPLLPPAFQLVSLHREVDAFERARRAAPRGLDDGTVYWSDRTDRLLLAVAIEPEAPRAEALRAVHVLGVAAVDALGALVPPGLSLAFAWPGDLVLDGARVGRVRAALGATADAGEVPPWLVLGLEVEVEASAGTPGDEPHDRASLADSGAGEAVTAVRLAEDTARHFLGWAQRCRDEGFGPVRDAWNARCFGRGAEATFEVAGQRRSGVVRGLDEGGDLCVGAAALPLEAALAEQG